MTALTSFRRNNGLYTGLLFMVGLTFMLTWLPSVRSLFDGRSYEWGLNYFGFTISGQGISSHYVFLLIQLVFFSALFLSFYWIRNRIVNYTLLGLWWVHIFGNLLFDIVVNGDTEFHGDTMNVHISLSMIVIPLAIITLGLIILTVRKDMNSLPVTIPWSRKNARLAWIVFGPLPIQAILLATGQPHGTTDQIGVLISIAQCFLIPFVVRPYHDSPKVAIAI